MATATVLPSKKPLSAVRKSTRKPKSVQTAIAAKRISGASKRQIARDLGIAVNTVTNIVELNDIDTAITQYRMDAIALAPLALNAIETDLKIPGNGALGLRVLESTGIVGENAIESARLSTVRQRGAINVLVQAGATVTIPTIASASAGKHNVPLSDTTAICSDGENDENNRTVPNNDKVTDAGGTPTGKHPKAAPGHQ